MMVQTAVTFEMKSVNKYLWDILALARKSVIILNLKYPDTRTFLSINKFLKLFTRKTVIASVASVAMP